MNCHIKIITLDKQSDHSQWLIKQIENQGLTGSFSDAVDGRQAYPELLDGETINHDKSMRYRGSQLTTSEVGCYLSHYRCVYWAYHHGIDKLCVLEDDVKFEDSFSSTVEEIYQLPEKYEFVRLMGLKNSKRKVIKTLASGIQLTRLVKGNLGAQGYVINRSGMKKILEHGSDMRQPVDKLYDHFWEVDLNLYSLEPHLIWERVSNSSIKKPKFTNKKSLSTSRKYEKIKRSFKRKMYIFSRFSEFFPNSKAKKVIGKTQRKLNG